MAHESFENNEVGKILNEGFISIKIDKEERPDIDSIYMNVCQSFTGSGGWPLTIIMTPEQKPFFAGTYLPKKSHFHSFGLTELLQAVKEKWSDNDEKAELIKSGEEITNILNKKADRISADISHSIVERSIEIFKKTFDKSYGGFGAAPKFPSPHNLLFLLNNYLLTNDNDSLEMVEKTLLQMYKGGIFDHIGFGFSRYSTDKKWLAPHFEKMLYDNALLTIAYLKAYEITKNELYKIVAIKTIDYVLKELTSDEGGFYCAQDADSENIEGKYYVFTPNEIINILGETDGETFNNYFDITKEGNFEGKNIPNLINNTSFDENIKNLLPKVYEYRKCRTKLHKDDKILTSWNALMIVALANAYKILGDEKYLDCAKRAINFIDNNLCDGNKLFVSFREGKKSSNGFLDDYAFYIWAQIEMYEATFDNSYVDKAIKLNESVINNFYDSKNGGFYLYSKDSERLILRPKEVYDGAIPSGNSVMSYNLIKLSRLSKSADLESLSQKQLEFMASSANEYPMGHSFYMLSLLFYLYPSKEIVCVLKDKNDILKLKRDFPTNTTITVLEKPTKEYSLKDDKTTYYICENHSCLPPTNEI